MRLPVITPLKARSGISVKDARLTNVLKTAKVGGNDLAVVRPGLIEAAVSTGNGNGLVCFGGELVSVYGSSLGVGVLSTGSPPITTSLSDNYYDFVQSPL